MRDPNLVDMDEPVPDGQTRLGIGAAWRLIQQAWYVVVVAEQFIDELPEELAFEIRALEAMSGEHVEGENVLAARLAELRADA